jgi:hypothetical protein
MRTRIFVVALTGMCMGVTSASAQTGQLGRSPNASQDPCPRGSRTITFDTNAGATSLEDLIQRSEVILVGAVVNVLPATRLNSERLDLIWLIETTSLISVNELLMGTLAPGTRTISISQAGGRVEPCTLVVPKDPLVSLGEDYVLFLFQNKRTNPPNTTGSPRYARVGDMAKIANGKIQFLPGVSEGLHKYDNTDATAFIATLKARISQLFPTRGR